MTNKDVKEVARKYITRGYVFGYDWYNQPCSYQAKTGTYNTRQEAGAAIIKGVEDGSLDSGLGFQKLTGARMIIEEVIIIEVDGKEYSRAEHSEFEYGEVYIFPDDTDKKTCKRWDMNV